MTGTDAITKSITITKGSKTATLTITDTAGDGFDSNDTFKITGDSSIFTSKVINDVLSDYKIIDKGTNKSTDVEKDSNGKVKISKDKEYRLGSLADSIVTSARTKTNTSVATVTPVSANSTMTTMALRCQELCNRYKNYLANLRVMSLMPGGDTQAYNAAMTNYFAELALINSTPATVPPTVTPAVTPPPATTTAVAPEAKTPVDPNAELFVDEAPVAATPEEKAPGKVETKPEETKKVEAKPVEPATTKGYSKKEAERAKIEAQRAVAYKNAPAAKKIEAQIKDLNAKKPNTPTGGRMDYGSAIREAQARLDYIQSGKAAQAKEAEILKLIEDINARTDKYKKTLQNPMTADQAGFMKDSIEVWQDHLKGLFSELSDLEADSSDTVKNALRDCYMNLRANGINY